MAAVWEMAKRTSTGLKLLLLACLAGVCVLWRFQSSLFAPLHDAYRERIFDTRRFLRRKAMCTQSKPCTFKIVADMDEHSRTDSLLFRSVLMEGSLYFADRQVAVQWKLPVEIFSKHNEGGRGMELSELILTEQGQLLSMDDRTGIVFEHINVNSTEMVVPRHVVTEGDGMTSKGMKVEWATEKAGDLWMGSFGKEYTGPGGKVLNEHNMWVVTLSKEGRVRRYDWKSVYDKIRMALGASWPGYAIHEAVGWSPIHKLWIFLPRRVSSEPYDDVKDESRGSNLMVLADEGFAHIQVREVGMLTPTRGFSSFKFLPGSGDSVIVALKSEEEAATGKQKSYITAFNLDGSVLLEESKVPAAHKFEGLEFVARNEA
eukprot:GHVS01095772.1.p1 GENE.GHVS01095772.1~~GHVS01095772.1.p1  ORF type:complete len:373 (-),score=77.12 GHVS01095772.1:179-1297(-)